MKILIDSSALVVILGAFLGGIAFDFYSKLTSLNRREKETGEKKHLKIIEKKKKELILFNLISLIVLIISLVYLENDSEVILVIASTFCWEVIKDIKEEENNLAKKILFSFAAFYIYLGLAYCVSLAIPEKNNEFLTKSDELLNWITSYGLIFLGGLIFFITNKTVKRVPILKQQEIIIKVNSETAKAYQATSEGKRRKIEAFLNFQLRKALKPRESLQESMDKLGQEAQANGLTPEILQEILDDE